MITKSIPIAAVLGNNVAYSLSPAIHNYWLNKYKIAGYYIPIYVKDNQHLAEIIPMLPKIGCVGFNITIPYKDTIIQYMDSISEVAQAMGSVNTVSYNDKDGFYGDNSDYIGFLNHFKSSFNTNLDNSTVVIIGAGGTTRAVIYALSKFQNVKILLLNRSLDNAIKIKETFKNINIECYPLNNINDSIKDATAIINTSSMGMYGENNINIDWKFAKPEAKVVDVIYIPKDTNFIKSAKEAGLQTENGLGMLIHQAVLGFSKWFNYNAIVEQDIYDYINKTLENRL